MSTPNTNKLLDGTLNIVSSNNFNSYFYSFFNNNIESFYNNPTNSSMLISQTNQLVTNAFQGMGPPLLLSQYKTLISTILSIKPIYNQPAFMSFMTSLSQNAFINFLTTGSTSENVPTLAQQTIVSNVITNYGVQQDSRANQFSCVFSYPNYANNGQFVINFSSPITPDITGACLGLLALVDNNKIDSGDTQILLNLIKLYSNAMSSVKANNITLQTSVNQSYTQFNTSLLNSVSAYLALPTTPSNRNGNKNIPPPTISVPGLLNSNLEIISSASLNSTGNGPPGIVLNQFTESNFNDVNSILDIIRNTNNAPIVLPFGPTIFVQGTNISGNNNNGTTSQNGTDASQQYGVGGGVSSPESFSSVISILKANPPAYENAINVLSTSIEAVQIKLDELTPLVNAIINQPDFILLGFITGFLPATATDSTPNIDVLQQAYNGIASSLQSQPKTFTSSSIQTSGTSSSIQTSTQSSTIQSSIDKSNFQTISGLNYEFRYKLGIYTPFTSLTSIQPNVIKTVNTNTNNNPPLDFQTIVSLTNRGDITDINDTIHNLCESVVSDITETSGKQANLNNQIANYQRILNELKSS